MKPKRLLPSLDAPVLETSGASLAELGMPAPAPAEAPTRATLEFPVQDYPPHCYAQQHVEVRLSENQAHTLRRVLLGLEREGAMLLDGTPVRRSPDVFRWLLETIAEQA